VAVYRSKDHPRHQIAADQRRTLRRRRKATPAAVDRSRLDLPRPRITQVAETGSRGLCSRLVAANRKTSLRQARTVDRSRQLGDRPQVSNQLPTLLEATIVDRLIPAGRKAVAKRLGQTSSSPAHRQVTRSNVTIAAALATAHPVSLNLKAPISLVRRSATGRARRRPGVGVQVERRTVGDR